MTSNGSPQTPFPFDEWMIRLFEQDVPEAELEQFRGCLQDSPRLLERYAEFALMRAAFNRPMRLFEGMEEAALTDVASDFWQAMAEDERVNPTVELPEAAPVRELITGVRERKRQLRSPHAVSRLSLYTAVGGLAALLMMVVYVVMNPRFIPEPVATLTDTYEARWETPQPDSGARLTNAKSPLRLLSGYAKLQFDNGAEVIVEGPSEFYLVTAEQMGITQGKLTAVVPPAAAGFRVDTPAMSVIDLGTEFSVKAGWDGFGAVHLHNGKASLLTGELGTRRGSYMLAEGQARSVNPRTGRIEEIALEERDFVRRFKSDRKFIWRGEPLGLVSLIAGGNGFDPVFDYHTLNPNTGEYETKLLKSEEYPTTYAYTPVPANPFIDGVFVPSGDHGPTVITSEGHTFNSPVTSGVFTFNIAASFRRYDRSESIAMPALFDGTQHHTEAQPSVLLHSNVGITLDLHRIRQAYPGLTLKQFHTRYGSSWSDRRGQVDFFVLVDGVLKFEHKELASREASYPAVVELSPDARFLTVVVTDCPKSSQTLEMAHEYDYFYLLDPKLILY